MATPGLCSLDVTGVSGPEQTGKQRPGIAVRDLQERGERHRRAAAPHINCVRHSGVPEILGTALFQVEVSVLLIFLLIKELG